MWKKKLCLGTSGQFKMTVPEQISLFKKVGFEGFFTGWEYGSPLCDWADCAKKEGMIYQSVHAPFVRTDRLWREGEEGDAALNELIACLRDCEKAEVPIMVSHTFIGFKDHTPTEIGVERFGKLVCEAEKLGMTVAFENTEGEEYLAAVMNAFSGSKAVGFCWDTGHELCYNHSQDMTALYGSCLAATHINDNLGIRDFAGNITYHDDLHLLPFDGITDWDSVGARLKACRFDGPLTFELNTTSKPNRLDNEIYAQMPVELYITEAYKRACRVAAKCL